MLKDSQRLEDVIPALSDDICVRIMKLVADGETRGREFVNGRDELVRTDGESIMEQLKISPKLYYIRMRILMDNNLLRREKKGGSHHLSAYGRTVMKALAFAESARTHFSRLRVLDSIDFAQISHDDYAELLGVLIKDHDLKEYLRGKPLIRLEDKP
jgi:DNA-binding transcriptional ArsR family regulator